MRVLHVIPSVSPIRGGPSSAVRAFAAGLGGAGVEVHVATTDDNGPTRQRVPLGIPREEDGATYWYFRRVTRLYTTSFGLTSWLRRNVAGFDVVHIHSVFTYPTAAGAYWAHRKGVPYVVRPLGVLNRWGMETRRPRLKRLSFAVIEKRILAGASAIHFTTEQERGEAGVFGFGDKSVVIANPVGPIPACSRGGLRERFPSLENRRIILFLSRLDLTKGIDLLLRAYGRLRGRMPDTALVMAGSGDERFVAGLRDLTESLGIAPYVVWAGFLEGEAKSAAYADADVFVLPSHSESFGVAVAEAIAAGVPAIVSDRVGIAAELASAGAALVVPRDPASLASAMERVLGDAGLAQSLSGRGREFVRRRYSPDAVVSQLLALYARIARKPACLE